LSDVCGHARDQKTKHLWLSNFNVGQGALESSYHYGMCLVGRQTIKGSLY